MEPETIKSEHNELVHYNEVSGNNEIDDKSSKLAQFMNPSVYRPLRLVMTYFFISDIVSMLPCRAYLSRLMADVGIEKDSHDLLLVKILRYYTIYSSE